MVKPLQRFWLNWLNFSSKNIPKKEKPSKNEFYAGVVAERPPWLRFQALIVLYILLKTLKLFQAMIFFKWEQYIFILFRLRSGVNPFFLNNTCLYCGVWNH